jgi:dimethylargininase
MSLRIALTRPISASFAQCELTYLNREPIDLGRAREQHASYEALLASLGWKVVRLPALDEHPDAVFVEDAAIALEELAVVAPMGAASRSGESRTVAEGLARYRPVVALESPATLDGGDVLVIGRRVFVGLSSRTNADAADQLRRLLAPYEYQVIPVPVRGALHLKSACTYVGDETLLANAGWVDTRPFSRLDLLHVDDAEAWGASALFTGAEIVMPDGFPRTRGMLEDRAYPVHVIDLTEIRKAEGGPTCLSILLNADTR